MMAWLRCGAVAWQTTPPGILVLGITALVTLAAIARLTRLVTDDALTAPLRNRLQAKAADRWYAADESKPDQLTHALPAPRAWRYAAKLSRCPWCLGFWISAGVVLAYFSLLLDAWPWHSGALAFAYIAGTFAASQFVGLAADWLDSPPPVQQIQLLPAHVTVRDDGRTP